MTEDQKWQAAFDRLTQRGFMRLFKVSPKEVAKAWDMPWTIKSFYDFASWCMYYGLHPSPTVKEVNVQKYAEKDKRTKQPTGNYTINYGASAMGGIRCLINRRAITDVLQQEVVYDGDSWTWMGKELQVERNVSIAGKAGTPLFAYLLAQRPTGALISVRVEGSILQARVKDNEFWNNHRHEMFLAVLHRQAFKRFRVYVNLVDDKLFVDDEPDADGPEEYMEDYSDDHHPEPVQGIPPMDGPPPMEAPNDTDDFPF